MHTSPPLPESRSPSGQAGKLLPLIRGKARANGLVPWRRPRSLAVFHDAVILFKASRKHDLGALVDSSDDFETKAREAGTTILRKIRIDEVMAVSSWRRGKDRVFQFSGRSGAFSFRLPETETAHLHLVLSILFGGRLKAPPAEVTKTAATPWPGRGFVIASFTVLTGVGLVFAAFRLVGVPDVEAFAPTLSAIGIFLSGFSLLYLAGRWFRSIRRRQKGSREPYRSPFASLVLRMIGFALFVAGWLFPWEVARLAGSAGWIKANDPVQEITGLGLFNLGFIFLALPCIYLGYRLGLRSADTVLRDDTRPATLFLRSFGDDGRHTFNPDSIPAKLLGLRVFKVLERLGPLVHLYPVRAIMLSLGTARDTAEEQLASYFRRLGPFVAIGRPGEGFAEGGADRIYVSHDVWQDRVLSLLDRSACVILQPADTSGVWWEIETCLRIVPKGRLLLSLVNYLDSQQAYEEFRLRFEDLGGPSLPRCPGDAIFLWIDPENRVVPLPVVHHFPLWWPLKGNAVDFKNTLLPFLKHFDPDRFLRVSPQKRSPALQRAGMAVALLCWCGLWWTGPIVFGNWRREVATGSLPDMAHNGRAVPYVWRLEPEWIEIPPLGVEDRRFRGRSGAEFASVAVVKGMGDDLYAIEGAFRDGDILSLNRHTRIRQREFERDGIRWLRTEEKVKNRKDPLSLTIIRDVCSHPDGAFFVQVLAPSLLLEWQSGLRERLERTLDGFRPPPEKSWQPRSYHDAAGRFSIDLPAGWIEQNSEGAGIAARFQYWQDPLAVVSVHVIEPPLPTPPDPAAAMERLLESLKPTGYFSTVLSTPEWSAVSQDRVNRNGLDWIDTRVLHSPVSVGLKKDPSTIHHIAHHFAPGRTYVLEAATADPPSPRVEEAIAAFLAAFRLLDNR